MYPVLQEGASIGNFTYEDSTKEHFYAENVKGEMFEIDEVIYNVLMEADGTHSLYLDENTIEWLKSRNLIRTSRFVYEGNFQSRLSIFFVGERAKVLRYPCRIINAMLPVISLLIFISSLMARKWIGWEIGDDANILFYGIMFVGCVVFHEMGHMIAAIAYDYTISEVGLLFWGPFPIGAYVSEEENGNDEVRWQQTQFALAGVEVNLLIAGICIFLSMLYYPLSFTSMLIACINILMVAINILPSPGLDGEIALSTIFGVESIAENARIGLTNEKWRKKLMHSGLPGLAGMLVFSLIFLANYVEKGIMIGSTVLSLVLIIFY